MRDKLSDVFVARLICSDQDCAETSTVEAATLRELELLACECGCALEIIGWPDTVAVEAEVVVLHERFLRVRGGREAA